MLVHHRQGQGEPLVLIHGIGHHGRGWDPVARLLAPHFDVIATDTPGFGHSPPLDPLHPPTIERYADAFEAFFADQGLDRPHVAGNSMGGGIALELARRKAARTVTAISPIGFWSDRERRWVQVSLAQLGGAPAPLRPALLAATSSRIGRAALFSLVFSRPTRIPPDAARTLLERAWGATAFRETLFEGFDAYDFAGGDELRGTPVTVAWGTRDVLLIAPTQARRARERLPWAHHVPLPGLGHTPFTDDPGMVAEVIRAGTERPAPAVVRR